MKTYASWPLVFSLAMGHWAVGLAAFAAFGTAEVIYAQLLLRAAARRRWQAGVGRRHLQKHVHPS
jgi:hypothetical protein